MLVSQIFAWVSVFLCLMEVMRFAARISKVKALNHFFHKCHIPFGVLLLATSGFHALLAGNTAGAGLTGIELAAVFFTVNWGTFCFLCAALLAVSYLARKKLRQVWMPIHRVLTVLMIALLVFHLADVGIHLPERWAAPALPHVESENVPPQEGFPDPSPSAPVASVSPTPKTTPVHTPTAKPTAPPPAASSAAPELPEASEAGLADGVYTGHGQGRNGEITVNVTVQAGGIVDIQVVSHVETPKYFSRAEGIVDAILASQSTEVDAVTGATISSDGIKEAVANALGM